MVVASARAEGTTISSMPQHDETRGLLVRYLESLALAQQVTLKLLDFVQADAAPVTPEALRECRRFVGEALARIESSEAHAAQLWEVLEIERRVPGAPRPPSVPERRRGRRHTN
jgi:hypothetical protein